MDSFLEFMYQLHNGSMSRWIDMPEVKSSREFFDYDYFSALFPMETCRFLIGNGEALIKEYIARCLSNKSEDVSFQFLAQTRVFASKPKNHLRRTLKLDPVAEFFCTT